jgi:two-component system NtrC family sensor kinase
LSIKEDLIGPARKQNMATIRLADLLSETIGGMGLPGDVVRVEFAPDTPDICGDARQLNQVFNNLIKNAWEALHRHEQPRILVSARRASDGRSAIVRVRDNGPGIPSDLLDRIWVSFFTTKGDRGGTGLGLSACAGIVSQHGGKIWADSPPGQGATFSVLLPAA